MRPLRLVGFLLASALILAPFTSVGQPPKVGPKTEKRFPPLQVPAGFKATLFACDPLIEYPSVSAIGPRPGTLFVAIDYMTGLGTEIVRRDEVRLIEDTDGDGYADKSTVFATSFNSIQGLAYHNGTVFVMHAPYLTAVRDTKGTGKADERRDLLTGLGLPPEKDQIRLHNANGVVPGHDGWLYLALGDRGCDIKRPEGDRLVLEGGGILRCRPDGRDLHVFSTGLRNIYDVALDADLNVFVRDNENDGGKYKVRMCHSFFGADHGYPYLYDERPNEALPPLADLGLGSCAGGVTYLETQFPKEYRGNLFFCEWGRAVVRYRPAHAGASFAPLKEIDFAFGAPGDTYGFKPTDLVVGHDGSLFVSDWADGQRPKRGRGRIYQVRYVGEQEKPAPASLDPLVRLNSESYLERCQAQQDLERGKEKLTAVVAALEAKQLGVRARLHAVWLLARAGALPRLLALAKSDSEPRVQAQAVRAIADLADPVLSKHRLDASSNEEKLSAELARLAEGQHPRVLLEVIVALGRLRWQQLPWWLDQHLTRVNFDDPALVHAAQWALRRSNNSIGLLDLLDVPSSRPIRSLALRAVAGQFDPKLVDGLIERLPKETGDRLFEYADLLIRVCRKPGAWVYWGFRPGPRPANTVAWDRTNAIELALGKELDFDSRPSRLPILYQLLREKITVRTLALAWALDEEKDAARCADLIRALGQGVDDAKRKHLEGVLRNRDHTTANRLLAASLFLSGLDVAGKDQLLAKVGADIEDGPVLAELLRKITWRSPKAVAPLVLRKLTAQDVEVRAAALAAAAHLELRDAHESIRRLLDDPEPRIRSAAALAAGKLDLPGARARLLQMGRDSSPEVRRTSLEMLRQLREPRALPLALEALKDQETVLKALECIGELGGLEHAGAIREAAQRQPAAENLLGASKVLVRWATDKRQPAERHQVEAALAGLQGNTGALLGWYTAGQTPPRTADQLLKGLISGELRPTGQIHPSGNWTLLPPPSSVDARVYFGITTVPETLWLAYTEVDTAEVIAVDFSLTSPGRTTVWLNSKQIHQSDRPGAAGPYPARFDGALVKGRNWLLVQVDAGTSKAEFHLRFRRKSAAPERERFALAALSRAGNPANGKKVFLNAEKSQCLKCHRLGDQGEKVGPELTGLGNRFSKIHIVESILEPSRTIAPSFETFLVTLKNGRSLSGVKIVETETAVTLVDNQTAKHVLLKADIDEQQRQPISTMPDGLEKRLTEDEFVDLVSYLVNLKETRGR